MSATPPDDTSLTPPPSDPPAADALVPGVGLPDPEAVGELSKDPGLATAADPAAQSLADALRVSFLILKLVMVTLAAAYLFTGYFTVDEQQAAVKMRFGQLVGEPGERVLGPGPHFGLPVPFESHLIVRTAPQTFMLDQAFWYALTDEEQQMTVEELAASGRRGPLNPLVDGYLITGDANIVHGRFRVTYRVFDVERYVIHVGDETAQRRLVEQAVQASVVARAATVEADDFISGRTRLEGAASDANAQLEGLNTGLVVDNIEVLAPTMPIQVRGAYNAVNNAESDRATLIEQAQRDRAKTLAAAAGPAAAPRGAQDGPLARLIDRYEATPEDDAARDTLKAELDSAFRELALETEQGSFEIGGQAASIIDEARSYRTNIVEALQREAQRFEELRPSYEQNPRLFKQRVWQAALKEMLAGDNPPELVFSPKEGQLYLEVNRDPAIAERREQERAQRASEGGGP